MKQRTKEKGIKLCAVIIFFILAATVCGGISNTFISSHAQAVQSEEAKVEVVSYEDIFKSYYEQVLDVVPEEDICTFDEFCTYYYLSEMDLPTYTTTVEQVLKNKDSIDEKITTDNSAAMPTDILPSSSDEYYILSSTDYAVTPQSEFRKEPIYNKFNYSELKEGDIVYETDTILFNAGHNAIIYDMSKNSEVGTYIQTIEAVGGGVQFGYLDDTRMVDFGVKILRVKDATQNNIEDAKHFCSKQVGKKYSLNPLRLNTSIDSTSWYCSELMYAAYKYAGIDIGVRKNSVGEDVHLSLGCIPSDIYKSYNVSEQTVDYQDSYCFLDLEIVSKTENTWTIKVINNTDIDIPFEYNSKMCFKNDAQKWSGLNDVVDDKVLANNSTEIYISENLFATSIVVSWTHNTHRYISYAYNLDNKDKTLKIQYIVI